MDQIGRELVPAVLSAKKKGCVIELSEDPHPWVDEYTAVPAPGLLVLFAKEYDGQSSDQDRARDRIGMPTETPDRDAHLRRAFLSLASRIPVSIWTSSAQPYGDMLSEFENLYSQEDVRHDINSYVNNNPSVRCAVEMLFTAMSMSARADWRTTPVSVRGVAARGWFLGRWIPTFLVLDGPIMRFMKSAAFQRQQGPSPFLRAARSIFQHREFMALRHAFAHWSFSWRVRGDDSEIVAVDDKSGKETTVTRSEADAFHIITFAFVEAIHEAFLERKAP